jgi:hypothetical protein
MVGEPRVFSGGNDRHANDMATKKTATKRTKATAKKKIEERSIESLLAKLRAAAPPESDKDLGRWVLGKMLTDMASKLLEGGEMKFASGDMLRVIQAIRELDEEEDKKKISGIRIEWVEPEKQ